MLVVTQRENAHMSLLISSCAYFCSHNRQISPSTTAMVTCVEEEEVRAATNVLPPNKSLANFTRAIQQQYSIMACYMYIKWTCILKNIYIMIRTMCHQGQQYCR